MLKESVNNQLEYVRLSKEEMESRGILGRLVGVCADFQNPTRNGRKYGKILWENVFESPLMKERIANKLCYGELGHPEDREETDMEKVAICLAEPPQKGKDGKLRAVFDILSTPNGKILKSLCDYGSTLGISSRGTGDVIKDYNGEDIVDPDTYDCFGFDIVLLPGVSTARLQYVTESLDKTRYNKTLKQKLTESINKEDENNQRIMRESLHDIGIDLDESLFEESAEYTPKFIDGMTIDELKAEEKSYYDDQYQYGKSLPMNRIWDIDFTIKELEKNLNESNEFNYEVVVRDSLGHESSKKFKTAQEAKDFANSQASGLITYINPLNESLDDKYLNKTFINRDFDGTVYTRVIGKDGDNYKLQVIDSPKTNNVIHEYSLSSSDMDIFDGKEFINESINLHELGEKVPGLTVDIWTSINGVMGAYQNANKWLDSAKEFIYSDLSCPFFSSFVHELAHTMPGRFDKFGDILHTMNIEVPYPTTLELDNMPTNIDEVFNIIFGCLDAIKDNLNTFIKATDENYHGMACSAEELLNDIESEYPMLFRLRDKWNQCNNDLVDFDKFVAQYTEHKEDLLESVDKDVLVYDSEAAKTDLFDVASPQEMADTFKKPVKDNDKIYYPVEEALNENIIYKDTEIIDNEDGTFTVTIDDETQSFNSLKNAKTWINMMKPQVDESLYVSAGKMNDELLDDAVLDFEKNIGDYGDALTFVKNRFSQYSLNDQKDIARYINKQLSESLDINMVDKAKKIAHSNFINSNNDTEIGFEFDGQWIIDPWMDLTGRLELTNEEAIETYGKNNVDKFIKLANSNKLTEANVDAKTSIKRLGLKLINSGDEIPGATYSDGSQAKVGDTVYRSDKEDYFTIVGARENGDLVLIAKNSNMSNGDTHIVYVGSPIWNKFTLKDRNAFRGSLTEAQVGRDDSKSIEDVGSEDHTPEPIHEPEKKEEKETTIIIKESLNKTEERAADVALSELRDKENVDSSVIRDVVSTVVHDHNTDIDDEDDPFAFEEADYFKVLDYVENKFNNNVNDNINSTNEAVDNNEAGIDKIYEMFNKNAKLEKKLTDLQEQLSASYARETRLKEEMDKYKNQIKQLAESSKQVEILESQLERANFQISEIENGISANEHKFNESLENSNKVKSKLTESIRQRDSRIKSLEEELDSTKKQNVARLNENKTLQKEYDSLQESYADAQKDVAQLKEQYSKKLEQKNELVEKYQKIANRAVDKYIESQAIRLGVTSNEIKNKLPRGYGFKDIDSICESLQEYKLNMSTLPFSASSLNEGVSLKARNVRQELLPRNEENEITDLELELASKMLK